jgi:hypothetical protein
MSSDNNSSDDLSVASAPPTETTSVAHAIVVDGKKKTAAQPQLSTDAPAKLAARHRWPSMAVHVLKDSHGKPYDSYPFFEDSNEQDKALVCNLLIHQPFAKKRGQQTAAWKNVVEMCNFAKMDGNAPVFQPPPNEKSAKQRFKEYISFIKIYLANYPENNSEGDNEPFPEIHQVWKISLISMKVQKRKLK